MDVLCGSGLAFEVRSILCVWHLWLWMGQAFLEITITIYYNCRAQTAWHSSACYSGICLRTRLFKDRLSWQLDDKQQANAPRNAGEWSFMKILPSLNREQSGHSILASGTQFLPLALSCTHASIHQTRMKMRAFSSFRPSGARTRLSKE